MEQHESARIVCVLRVGAPYATWTLNATRTTRADDMSRCTDTEELDDASCERIQAVVLHARASPGARLLGTVPRSRTPVVNCSISRAPGMEPGDLSPEPAPLTSNLLGRILDSRCPEEGASLLS